MPVSVKVELFESVRTNDAERPSAVDSSGPARLIRVLATELPVVGRLAASVALLTSPDRLFVMLLPAPTVLWVLPLTVSLASVALEVAPVMRMPVSASVVSVSVEVSFTWVATMPAVRLVLFAEESMEFSARLSAPWVCWVFVVTFTVLVETAPVPR